MGEPANKSDIFGNGVNTKSLTVVLSRGESLEYVEPFWSNI